MVVCSTRYRRCNAKIVELNQELQLGGTVLDSRNRGHYVQADAETTAMEARKGDDRR